MDVATCICSSWSSSKLSCSLKISLCFWLGGWNHSTHDKMFPDNVPRVPSDRSVRPAGQFWASISATASGLLLANVRGKQRDWIKVRNCCIYVFVEASHQHPREAVVFARRQEGDYFHQCSEVNDVTLRWSAFSRSWPFNVEVFFTPSFKS